MWWHLSGNIMQTSGPQTLTACRDSPSSYSCRWERKHCWQGTCTASCPFHSLVCPYHCHVLGGYVCSAKHHIHWVSDVQQAGVFLWQNMPERCSRSSLRMTQAGMVFQNLSFLPSIQLTPQRLRPHFGSLCVSEPIFFSKITRAIGVFEVSLRNPKADSDKCVQNYVKRQ
jgi:hypothetical protein